MPDIEAQDEIGGVATRVSLAYLAWCWFAWVLCVYIIPVPWRLWYALLPYAGYYAHTPRWEFRGQLLFACYD